MVDNEAELTRKAQRARSANPDDTNPKKRVQAEPTYRGESLNVSKDEYDTTGPGKSQRTAPFSRYVPSLKDGPETPGWAASKAMVDNEAELTRKAQRERSASPDDANPKKRVEAEPTYRGESLNVSKDEYDTTGPGKSQRTAPFSRYVPSLKDGPETPGWAASKAMVDNEAELTRKAQRERSASPDDANPKKRVQAEPTYRGESLNVSKDEYDTTGPGKSQ
ncbi:uncharacterized protein LOC142563367 [Dermacentor variabilis]|uniref:uncharacterized protein LOC142563367 n=1 Tax=Dermacentor variabilis TaxID=34621 RepID=UPI003F5BA714